MISIMTTVTYYTIACIVLFMLIRFYYGNTTKAAKETEEKSSIAQLTRSEPLLDADPEVTANVEQVLSTVLSTDMSVEIYVGSSIASAGIVPDSLRNSAVNNGDNDAVKSIKDQISGEGSTFVRKSVYKPDGIKELYFIKSS